MPRIALAEIHTQRGELDRARELLDWCVEHYPDFFGNVLPYATVLLRSGWEAEAVVAEIESRVGTPSPTVRFMLGTALYEAGATEAAEAQYRAILAHHAGRVPVQIALGETLLAQKRYEEAARLASAIEPENPLGALAARSELFALLTAGLLERVPDALARAQASDLPAAEQELFSAWAAVLGGGERASVSPAAAPLLEVMLEALLRVEEFVVFEGLVALLQSCGLPERERRERLAAMYLRRGFLASAAEEWMAVCQQRPDARALVGLAQVALAHGLPEDAATFAGEALGLDPASVEARALLAHCAPAPAGVI
jgi:tetratricopeptide (TPR) repeat protein